MRAKRSKRYRKLMHQYELTFGFREPYQVLVDSNFLRAVHNFKMDLILALERTLQGKVKPLLSKCSLATIMASQPMNPQRRNPRPACLPLPTILPLRHCSHNDDDTPIDEVDCLLSLLCPNLETMRNKEHYILATAGPPAPEETTQSAHPSRQKKRSHDQVLYEESSQKAGALRAKARSIPGVPIVYVKRSVMILEPMSVPSEKVKLGVEKSKLKTGVDHESSVMRKRKRDEDEPRRDRNLKKAKGPNPLSVKKPKKRERQRLEDQERKDGEKTDASETVEIGEGRQKDAFDENGTESSRTKRRRRHRSTKMKEESPKSMEAGG